MTWFGYSPEYGGNSSAPPTPLLKGVDRGLRGTLACIQGPGNVGYTTATLTSQGVEYGAWGQQC